MIAKKDALEREMFEAASLEGPNGGPADDSALGKNTKERSMLLYQKCLLRSSVRS